MDTTKKFYFVYAIDKKTGDVYGLYGHEYEKLTCILEFPKETTITRNDILNHAKIVSTAKELFRDNRNRDVQIAVNIADECSQGFLVQGDFIGFIDMV